MKLKVALINVMFEEKTKDFAPFYFSLAPSCCSLFLFATDGDGGDSLKHVF